jgi:putative transposase
MTSTTKSLYTGHRFPPELISYTVWLHYCFPLSLRMVEEMLGAFQAWHDVCGIKQAA